MAVPPATQMPLLTPAEMQILVSRTGLVLNPGQVADLVLAWRQIAGLIATMPRERPLADDMALMFRLPAPGPTPGPTPGRGPGPAALSPPASAERKARQPATQRPPTLPTQAAPKKQATKQAAKTNTTAKRAPTRRAAPKR